MNYILLISVCVLVFFRICIFFITDYRKKLEDILHLKETFDKFENTKHAKKPFGIQKRMLNLKQYQNDKYKNIQG